MGEPNPITTMLVAAARKKAEDAGVPGVIFDMVVSKLDGGAQTIGVFFDAAINAKHAEAIASLSSAAKDLTALASGMSEKDAEDVIALRDTILAEIADHYDSAGDDDDAAEEEEVAQA